MKSLMLAFTLLAGLNVQASTVDTYSLPLTGEQTEQNFTLNAVQTRTEYRSETVTRTCYRTVADGYNTVCHQVPVDYCYEDRQSRRICGVRYENRCRNEVRYRTEAYTCYETVSIPYEVFNNNSKANVNVVVASVPGTVTAPHNSCLLDFALEGNAFRAAANCAEFIVLSKSIANESREGATLVQNRSLELTLLDAKAVSAPTSSGIKEMRLEGQTLVFRTGDLTKNSNFSLKLFVERRNLLKKDESLINRNLAPSEYSFEKTSDENGLVKINLSKLIGGVKENKKHVIKVDMKVLNDTSSALNRNLPSLSASESITVNQ